MTFEYKTTSSLVDLVKCPLNPRNERCKMIGKVLKSNNSTPPTSKIGQSTIATTSK